MSESDIFVDLIYKLKKKKKVGKSIVFGTIQKAH